MTSAIERRWRDTAALAMVALALRLMVVAWAMSRFPPAADGSYYQVVASRIAAGHGYTWLWPDGAVTYAAHYPVGLPAMMGGLYALLGTAPGWAMLLNALFGTLMVVAVHRLLAPWRRRRIAALGALLVCLHPGLLMYTAAIMTEGVTAALLVTSVWLVQRARRAERPWRVLALLGLVLGVCTLVRPQSLLMAPLLGVLAVRGGWRGGQPGSWRRRLWAAAGCTLLCLATVAPWTLRNCRRMERCALVSVNGGWNLLIGTQPEGKGGWSQLQTPPDCRNVFHEAHKDSCFQRAAVRHIRAEPLAWLRLAPAKLGVTFDYCGAPGWYLHESNPKAFSARAKWWLGAGELLYERVMLLLALCAAAPSPRRPWRRRSLRDKIMLLIAIAGMLACFGRSGWIAVMLLIAVLALRSLTFWRLSVLSGATLLALATTTLVHAVFFGAGRYQLVVLPLITAMAALGVVRLADWRSWRPRRAEE